MSRDRYDLYDDNLSAGSHRRNSSSARSRTAKSSPKRKRKKKKSLKARFFTVLIIILGVYCIGALSYFGLQYYLNGNLLDFNNDGVPDNPVASIVKPKLKERTTFVVMGVDKDGTRTDTIMVCCYNDTLGELNIISIPRDTIIRVDDETFNMMQEEFPEPGQHAMKINAVHHYGAERYGIPLLEKEIEKIIGVPVDYYVKVKFEALEYLVDSIGGIEYDVPMRMYYSDPGQDLLIDLQPGLQTLNGKQAVHLVRFRYGYDNQDIDRVQTQQDFCKVLIKKLVDTDTIFANATKYVTAVFRYIDTDVRISDAIKYMAVLKDFNPDNIYTATMPGYMGSLYDIAGGYVLDEAQAESFCYDIFQKPSEEIKAEREAEAAASAGGTDAADIDDKTLSVQVLNGGYTNGKASQVQNSLLNLGYDVVSIGTYQNEKTDNTRVYVSTEGMGNDIAKEFNNAEVIVDPSVASEYDIVVVIGIGE